MHVSRSSPGLGKFTTELWWSRTKPAGLVETQKESAGKDEDVHFCCLPDMEASWILIPKPSPLSSPRPQPSTTLSSMQSFIPNIGEGSRSPHHWFQDRKMRYVNCRQLVIFNRDTLASKVPCLHFLSQATRRECISVSQSESSLRDSMLSRHPSGCKAMFHRVMSMSTTDTVSLFSLRSDANCAQRCSLLLSQSSFAH